MTLLKKFIGWAHHRHTFGGRYMTWHTKADYEVCDDMWCRLAVWLEATFNPYAAWHDNETEASFRAGWDDAMNGRTRSIAELWPGLEDGDSEVADIDTGWPERD